MTLEEKLKQLILQRYRSIREFTQVIEMSYSTMDSILKRGIANASINNVIKITKELGISADELANGKIVSTAAALQSESQLSDVSDIIYATKSRISEAENLSIDGKVLQPENVTLILDALDVTLELVKRRIR